MGAGGRRRAESYWCSLQGCSDLQSNLAKAATLSMGFTTLGIITRGGSAGKLQAHWHAGCRFRPCAWVFSADVGVRVMGLPPRRAHLQCPDPLQPPRAPAQAAPTSSTRA